MTFFRYWLSSALLCLLLTSARAQELPDIENCLSREPNALRVEYGGKTYFLRDEECRQLFQTDPERFSQLFDALLEQANQTPDRQIPDRQTQPLPHAPKSKTEAASLVPS